jgi:hypothetical protein
VAVLVVPLVVQQEMVKLVVLVVVVLVVLESSIQVAVHLAQIPLLVETMPAVLLRSMAVVVVVVPLLLAVLVLAQVVELVARAIP